MTNSPDPRKSLSRRRTRHIVAVLAICLLIFVTWATIGGGRWRGEVSVMGATLLYPTELSLGVGSCNGNPEVVLLRETDVDVQVRVVANSTPFRGGADCQDGVNIKLEKPLGDRIVIDRHTGREVSLMRGVNIIRAELRSPIRLVLYVDSCLGDPQLRLSRETDVDVQMKVVVSSDSIGTAADDCQDSVAQNLRDPLGDRIVINEYNAQPVSVELVE